MSGSSRSAMIRSIGCRADLLQRLGPVVRHDVRMTEPLEQRRHDVAGDEVVFDEEDHGVRDGARGDATPPCPVSATRPALLTAASRGSRVMQMPPRTSPRIGVVRLRRRCGPIVGSRGPPAAAPRVNVLPTPCALSTACRPPMRPSSSAASTSPSRRRRAPSASSSAPARPRRGRGARARRVGEARAGVDDVDGDARPSRRPRAGAGARRRARCARTALREVRARPARSAPASVDDAWPARRPTRRRRARARGRRERRERAHARRRARRADRTPDAHRAWPPARLRALGRARRAQRRSRRPRRERRARRLARRRDVPALLVVERRSRAAASAGRACRGAACGARADGGERGDRRSG